MKPWQEDFIEGLKAGKPEAYLAKTLAGQPLAFVQGLRDDEPEFKAAWEDAVRQHQASIAIRDLTASALEKVLNAQVTDDRAAAYFGLSPKEFKARVEADVTLKKVYDVARDAGLAIAEIGIFDEARQGNWQAMQHFAKHKLGQNDAATGSAAPTTVIYNIMSPGESYRQLLGGGTMKMEVIEGEKVVDRDPAE